MARVPKIGEDLGAGRIIGSKFGKPLALVTSKVGKVCIHRPNADFIEKPLISPT